MPDPAWYRSLYWRIGLGFVALLAVLLAVQGVVFLWLTGRAAELLPARSPAEYAQTLATDLGGVLAENSAVDLDEYLNRRYHTTYRAFAVVMRDGRFVLSRRIPPPPDLSRIALGRLLGEFGQGRSVGPGRTGGGGAGAGGQSARAPGGSRPEGGRRGPGRGRGGPGTSAVFARVVVKGETLGMVAVTSDPRPLSAAVRDLGPALAIVAVGLLLAGTSVAALMIFRPTHRRLRSLQQAARAIGAGESGARAMESGGDEVALLSRTFNEMASGLEERTQALAAVDSSRRQLLADVSHELMTPLAAIRGYVETMSMADVKLDEPTRRRYLGIVADETERLEHIIGDLLDLARVEGGGGVWKREPVSVASLFERVRERHDPILRAKRVVLDTVREPGADVVVGDPNRLEQALQNLAANAVRHTPDGGRIHLSAARMDRTVRLAVEDSGPGIPEDHLARVFDRFYKVDGSRTGTGVPSGSGLGLSIVQAIVKRHGGEVTACNTAHAGAKFEIVLPAPPDAADIPDPAES
jgi:signal transduction histidine kinase